MAFLGLVQQAGGFALSIAVASGRYEKHLETLRRRYTHKTDVLLQALGRHFPGGGRMVGTARRAVFLGAAGAPIEVRR